MKKILLVIFLIMGVPATAQTIPGPQNSAEMARFCDTRAKTVAVPTPIEKNPKAVDIMNEGFCMGVIDGITTVSALVNGNLFCIPENKMTHQLASEIWITLQKNQRELELSKTIGPEKYAQVVMAMLYKMYPCK